MGRRIVPVFAVLGIGVGILFYVIGRHIARELISDMGVPIPSVLGTTLAIVLPLLVLVLVGILTINLVSRLDIHKM